MINRFGCIAFVALSFAAKASVLPDGFVEIQSPGFADRLFAASGPNAQRVGGAVLTRIYRVAENGGSTSLQMLLACDGTWASEAIQASYLRQGSLDLRALETNAAVREDRPPLEAVAIQDIAESSFPFAAALRKYAPQLCKNARQERRGASIPISSYAEDRGFAAGTTSIVVGTARISGRSIEVWMRTNRFFEKNWEDSDGKVLNDEQGHPYKHKVGTGDSTLAHVVFDCAGRRSGTLQALEYNAAGTATSDSGTSVTPPKLNDVVPDSVRELELLAVCRIYGKAN